MNSPFFLPRAAFLAAALFPPSSASAAPVPVPAAGDVFVGFRASDGQGAPTSYLVKIGADTGFRNAGPGTEFDVTGLGNVGADLAAAYGADWSTRSDLYWGVFASRVSSSSSVYASKARTTTGTVATAWPVLTQTSRNATAQTIVDVISSIGGYDGSEATANSTVATLQPNSAQDSSYFRQVATAGTTDFGSLSQWTSIESSFAGGPAGAALDFFRLSGAGSSHVGTFTISSAGVIHFTAVPLPSQPDADTDGDGFKDSEETLAGTSPASAADFPRSLVSLTPEGPRIQSATAAANTTYTVEYSEDLGEAPWISVSTGNTGAAAAPVDFVDTDAGRRAKARGFYRIRFSS
ncbi:MAG: thrombospondin type 3 repeat-containing protein [Verrucomicrobiota bacterium]